MQATDTVTVAEVSTAKGYLRADRGPGATYRPGDPLELCHSLDTGRDYTLKLFKRNALGYEYQIAQVTDDGTGDCFEFLVSLEIGPRRYRAEFYTGGDLVATAYVDILVVFP